MKALNEPIAREANRQDKCTGKFWEARFKSQALLDEKALVACMAYVDLNPVRADLAKTPEESAHTSIKRRIEAFKFKNEQPHGLAKFIGNPRNDMPQGLPIHLQDYIDLVDWTGRIKRQGKRGSIADDSPPILERLDIEPEEWMIMATEFESRFKTLVGCVYRLKQAAQQMGFKRTPNLSSCRAAFH